MTDSTLDRLEKFYFNIKKKEEEIKKIKEEITEIEEQKWDFFTSITQLTVNKKECNFCGKMFNSHKSQKCHSVQCSDNPVNIHNDPCPKCGIIFRNGRGQKYHNIRCKGPVEPCYICGKVYSTICKQKEHNVVCKRNSKQNSKIDF